MIGIISELPCTSNRGIDRGQLPSNTKNHLMGCNKTRSFLSRFMSIMANNDVQVNNAAIIAFGTNGDFSDYESAKAIMETNFYGVKHVTQRLLPLLRPSPAAARIINVTSNWALYQVPESCSIPEHYRTVR